MPSWFCKKPGYSLDRGIEGGTEYHISSATETIATCGQSDGARWNGEFKEVKGLGLVCHQEGGHIPAALQSIQETHRYLSAGFGSDKGSLGLLTAGQRVRPLDGKAACTISEDNGELVCILYQNSQVAICQDENEKSCLNMSGCESACPVDAKTYQFYHFLCENGNTWHQGTPDGDYFDCVPT